MFRGSSCRKIKYIGCKKNGLAVVVFIASFPIHDEATSTLFWQQIPAGTFHKRLFKGSAPCRRPPFYGLWLLGWVWEEVKGRLDIENFGHHSGSRWGQFGVLLGLSWVHFGEFFVWNQGHPWCIWQDTLLSTGFDRFGRLLGPTLTPSWPPSWAQNWHFKFISE